MSGYVHGYSTREDCRLADQANTLSALLHHDSVYPPGSRVLECGCGTGAQTIFLAAGSPDARIVSMDHSVRSVEEARRRTRAACYGNVEFHSADIFHMPFEDETFDHLFVCFVLEHLPDPAGALAAMRRVVRTGGSITVIEGDHGSWYCHPQTAEASRAVQCQIEIQAFLGGDSLIGRRLYPLLSEAGFRGVEVDPRMVYVDDSRPELIEGFSKNTFIAMIEGVRSKALTMGLIDAATFDTGIRDMYRATEPGGTFCYTFFKARAIK